jgi:hypothetical protein
MLKARKNVGFPLCSGKTETRRNRGLAMGLENSQGKATGLRENVATPEGRELGAILARFCDQEAKKAGRDGRCGTCAFRAGDHVANGSAETLMSALKCAMEREPFWCHEHDRPCAGWALMRADSGNETVVPWPHIPGADAA